MTIKFFAILLYWLYPHPLIFRPYNIIFCISGPNNVDLLGLIITLPSMKHALNELERRVRIHELSRLLRKLGERPGGCVCSERMEGAAEARRQARALILGRLKELQID